MRFLCFVAFSNPKIDRQPFGQIAPPYNHGQYTTKPLKKSTESAKQVLLPKKFVWFYQILPLDFGDIASRVSCDGAGGERRGGRFFEKKATLSAKVAKNFLSRALGGGCANILREMGNRYVRIDVMASARQKVLRSFFKSDRPRRSPLPRSITTHAGGNFAKRRGGFL